VKLLRQLRKRSSPLELFRDRRHLRFELLEHRNPLAVAAALALSVPTVDERGASFDVTLDFAATAGERLSYFSLDLQPSSPRLVLPGPDYSAFSFAKASPLLDAWRQIGAFNDPGFESTVEYDDSLTAPLNPGLHRLGTLRVDLAQINASLLEPFTVAIHGAGTVIGVSDADRRFRFEPVTFAPASRTVTPIAIHGLDSVDEGSLYTLSIATPESLNAAIVVDWGDGQTVRIPAGQLPSDGKVEHLFRDGDLAATITVGLEYPNGSSATIGSIVANIRNVAPQITLAGASVAVEDVPYRLTLGTVVDPGADTVQRYLIAWGDGTVQTVQADALPPDRTLQHVYRGAAVPESFSISVSIVDEDGTHAARGTLQVDFLAAVPATTITASNVAIQGQTFPLTIGLITGSNSQRVVTVEVDWGDNTLTRLPVEQIPADRRFLKIYTTEPGEFLITVRLFDENFVTLSQVEHPVTVRAAAPLRLDRFQTSASVAGETRLDEQVQATALLSGTGAGSITSARIDWGDGTSPQSVPVEITEGRAKILSSHRYASGGAFLVTLEVTDQQGNVLRAEARAFVTGVRLYQRILEIVGSDQNDIVTVTPESGNRLFASITTPPLPNQRRFVALDDVDGIDLYLGAGDDRAMVSERLTVTTYIDGGPGNDDLQGGSGPNFLYGAAGDDLILGGNDRDILIAGSGIDRLVSYAGDDLLVGAAWNDPLGQRGGAFQTWQADQDLSLRLASLSEQLTLTADGQSDALFGGSGCNVYLTSLADLAIDGPADRLVEHSITAWVEAGWGTRTDPFPDIARIVNPVCNGAAGEANATGEGNGDRQSAARTGPLGESEPANVDRGPPAIFADFRDVNADGQITALDAILVINALNARRSPAGNGQPGWLDTNRDGLLTPLDALEVINYLNVKAPEAEFSTVDPEAIDYWFRQYDD